MAISVVMEAVMTPDTIFHLTGRPLRKGHIERLAKSGNIKRGRPVSVKFAENKNVLEPILIKGNLNLEGAMKAVLPRKLRLMIRHLPALRCTCQTFK